MTTQPIQAVTFTATETAALTELPHDAAPLGPREVAGRTLASLTSPGTELNWGYLGQKFPLYPGYACVFEVESVGAEVTDLRPGDRVFASGGHRSWQRHERARVLPVPAGLAAEAAVFARLMGVSMSTMVTTAARPPSIVLITGLGPVGNLAAQVFTACGYRVVASDPVESRQQLARRLGLTEVRGVIEPNDVLARQVSLHVECSGHEDAVILGLKLVRKGGEVVMVGVPWRKRSEAAAFDVLHAVFHRYAVLRSGWEWEVPIDATDFREGSITANYAAALRWLAEGRVKVDGLYLTAAPAEAQAVYQGLLKQTLAKPAAVFKWSN